MHSSAKKFKDLLQQNALTLLIVIPLDGKVNSPITRQLGLDRKPGLEG